MAMRSFIRVGAPIRLMHRYHKSSMLQYNQNLFLKSPKNALFNQMRPRIACYSTNASTSSSSSSAPPPPPPPPGPTPSHDKNAKGKLILNRATRAFTFSASTLMVIGASGVSLLVIYLILSELFLPSGETKTFNKALKLIEADEKAQKLLGFEPGTRLKAHGAGSGDKWIRNRPPQAMKTRGKDGKDRMIMKFIIETDEGRTGHISLEQVDESFWKADFAYIALDVPGHSRVYIIEPKFQHKNYVPRLNGSSGFLGLKWGPKKDKEDEE